MIKEFGHPTTGTAYQDRYVRVFADLGELRYYKNSKKGTPASGTVALNNIEWCRQVGESLDFEFLSGQRVFNWRAETVVSMQEWMKLQEKKN